MGFLKKIKKAAKKVFKVVHPVESKILGVGNDKKPAAGPGDPGVDVFGNPMQGTGYYQGELDKEMGSYRGAHDRAYADAKTDAQRAGTYADTREGLASLEGEAGARQRGMQSMSMNRINLLRKQLGLPETTSVEG